LKPYTRRLVCLFALLICLGLPARATVTVAIDQATLNDLLAALSRQELNFPVTDTHTVKVLLDDLRVLAIEPDAGENGQIRTSVRIRVPDFGLDVRVEPRVSFHVAQQGQTSFLELRFDEVPLQLPMTGAVNLASLVPPTRFPANSAWLIGGAEGDVEVRSRLVNIDMEPERIRFTLEIVVPEQP